MFIFIGVQWGTIFVWGLNWLTSPASENACSHRTEEAGMNENCTACSYLVDTPFKYNEI